MFKQTISSFIDSLLSRAMPKSVDISAVKAKRNKRIMYKGTFTPWVRCPDVGSFLVHLGPWDKFFAFFGIRRRLGVTLEFTSYKNKSINRYIEHQVIRLGNAREAGNNRLYFHICDMIMKRSNSFRILAINHVFPQWHRKFPFSMIMSANRHMSKLVNQKVTEMDYSRVYIPKPGGKFRPLGVPTVGWRLLLHQYSNFLTFFLLPKLGRLHGFLPGKGIVTAWKEILSGLHRMPYIYEIDFRGYFDSIRVDSIVATLLDYGLPMQWCHFLDNVNRSPIKLQVEDKVDESTPRAHLLNIQKFEKELGLKHSPTSLWYKLPTHIAQEHGLSYSLALVLSYLESVGYQTAGLDEKISSAHDLARAKKIPIEEAMYETMGSTGEELTWELERALHLTGAKGTAQGASTSPILSCLPALKWIKAVEEEGAKVVIYADDSIIFSEKEIPIARLMKSPHLKDTGIEFAPEKCGYVKFAGTELKPLIFLGLCLFKNFVRAHTRKGSRLGLSDRELLLGELFNELHDKCQTLTVDECLELLENTIEDQKLYPLPEESYAKLFNSRLAGFIVSRLQSGSWNMDDISQDFNLTFVNGSWVNSKLAKKFDGLDVFNSSSVANASLLNVLRYQQKFRKLKRSYKLTRLVLSDI